MVIIKQIIVVGQDVKVCADTDAVRRRYRGNNLNNNYIVG